MSAKIRTLAALIASLAISTPVLAQIFGDPMTYTLGSSPMPTSVACCDLDNDGWDDVVVNELAYDRVSILFNDQVGFGALEPPVRFDVGQGPVATACADTDGDGDRDVIVANFEDSTISILRNDGSRVFTHVNIPIGGNAGPRKVAACDLNHDGIVDLLTANDQVGPNNETLSVLLGLGSGSFADPVTTSLAVGSRTLLCADMDGNGLTDVILADSEGTSVVILPGHGDGTLGDPVFHAVPPSPRAASVCDVDGDGDADVVVAAGTSDAIVLLRNNGDGTFAAFENIGTIGGPQSVLCYDANQDGNADVLGSGDDAFVLLNEGGGSFSAPEHFPIDAVNPVDVAVGFLSGDCLPDLAIAALSSNELAVLINAEITLVLDDTVNYEVGITPRDLVQADFNGDGSPDFATANTTDHSVSVLTNNMDGTYESSPDIILPCSQVRALDADDFDGDGDMDIAASCHGDGGLVILFNDAHGVFDPGPLYLGVNQSETMASCDLDGDGDKDVIITINGTADLVVFLNNGDGTFASYFEVLVSGSPTDVACVDLNQDAVPDLVTSTTSSLVSVYYNNGDATFQPEQVLLINADPHSIVVCDTNGDALPDVVATTDDGVAVLRNNASGFDPYYLVGLGVRRTIACCNLDADGDNDLVVSAPNSHIELLLNNGAGQFQPTGEFIEMGGAGVCTDLDADALVDLASLWTFNDLHLVSVRLNATIPPIEFSEQPTNQFVIEGGTAVFNVAAQSDEALAYQWFRDGIAVPDEISPNLVIANASTEDESPYDVLVMGDCAEMRSASASLVVLVAGDGDRDEDVDFADFGTLQACFTGPSGVPGDPGCFVFDFDGDVDIDTFDVAAFTLVLGEPH